MAEDPPAALDDGVRAFVDLSTAEQIETYRHLEACSGPDIWLQASACERLAAKTIRSVYQTMLSSGSDETFQRARRLIGRAPTTLTVIEAERRRSSRSSDIQITGITNLLPLAGTTAQQNSTQPQDACDTSSCSRISTLPSQGHITSYSGARKPRAYESIAEDALPLHRRPVLFPAFLRALVLLLQNRLRCQRKRYKRREVLRTATPHARFRECPNPDDPNCLSFAWIALCRKLRIFSDAIEKQIQQHKSESREKSGTSGELQEQPLTGSDARVEEASFSLSSIPSERHHLRQAAQSRGLLQRKVSSSQQPFSSPARGNISKQSMIPEFSTDATLAPFGKGQASNEKITKESNRPENRTAKPADDLTYTKDEDTIAALAGRHAEVFSQTAVAEACCILNDALHGALFSNTGKGVDSSKCKSSVVVFAHHCICPSHFIPLLYGQRWSKPASCEFALCLS
ncbi:hypothetical protein, conserved [Eimeria necatrix]|uniref:Uncharacterized protein n=1 Tax=Eimeria necatrix TaxID=51315 RepID=U6MRK7_9EIME|nr:hypothetical protein, conserved [Eimeria necatrix]CDJ66852.1 hypothetical protein, conserved [Eimeria necatrix]